MIVACWVTEFHIGLACLCHASLKLDDVLHLLLSSLLLLAHEHKHLHDMLLVSSEDALVCFVILDVIVTLYRVATLKECEQIVLGRHHVGTDVAAPQFAKGNALCVHLIDESDESLSVLHLCHTLQVGKHRLDAICILADRIHAKSIEVAYLLTERTHLLLLCGKRLDDFTNALVVLFANSVERAETSILWRQRIVLHPSATGILIEICARSHTLVHVFHLDAYALSKG